MTGRIRFSKLLAESSDYSAPVFPILPHVPGLDSPGVEQGTSNVGSTLLTTHARNGLAVIAKAVLAQGDLVLLPAYHCRALVEPFIWAGCRIRFYTVNKDLSPKLDGFKPQLGPARAVVLVRYFGFDGDIRSIAKLAHEHDCLVIEDLAHAPFIEQLYGDFGVTSMPKFFPVTSGAQILIAPTRNGTALAQTLASHIQNPLQWQLTLAMYKLKQRLRAATRAETSQFCYFQEKGLGEPLSQQALEEISRHDANKIIAARRENYQFLDQLLNKSSLGRPLFSGLEANTTPYVFPFVLKNESNFDDIRNAGIPLFRWEEMATGSCEVSKAYRSKLIQIPCHQDLSADNLSLIEVAIKRIERVT